MFAILSGKEPRSTIGFYEVFYEMYYGSVPLHNKQFTRNVFREIYFYWSTCRDTVWAIKAIRKVPRAKREIPRSSQRRRRRNPWI